MNKWGEGKRRKRHKAESCRSGGNVDLEAEARETSSCLDKHEKQSWSYRRESWGHMTLNHRLENSLKNYWSVPAVCMDVH